jgi:hypothetical protein
MKRIKGDGLVDVISEWIRDVFFLSELDEFLIFSASSCWLRVGITLRRFYKALHGTIF